MAWAGFPAQSQVSLFLEYLFPLKLVAMVAEVAKDAKVTCNATCSY